MLERTEQSELFHSEMDGFQADDGGSSQLVSNCPEITNSFRSSLGRTLAGVCGWYLYAELSFFLGCGYCSSTTPTSCFEKRCD